MKKKNMLKTRCSLTLFDVCIKISLQNNFLKTFVRIGTGCQVGFTGSLVLGFRFRMTGFCASDASLYAHRIKQSISGLISKQTTESSLFHAV